MHHHPIGLAAAAALFVMFVLLLWLCLYVFTLYVRVCLLCRVANRAGSFGFAKVSFFLKIAGFGFGQNQRRNWPKPTVTQYEIYFEIHVWRM